MAFKDTLTKEFLMTEYIQNKRTQLNIANEVGCNESTVQYYIKKHKIPRIGSGCRTLKDISGKTFDKLTVISKDIEYTNKKRELTGFKRVYWLCQCECGNTTSRTYDNLKRNKQSCNECGYKAIRDANYQGYKLLSKSYVSRLHSSAIDRNIQFKVTPEQIYKKLIDQNFKCALSGVEIIVVPNYSRNASKQNASLDRIDSNKDYTIDNIQWIHKDLQSMKMTKTDEHFINWCHIISNYQKSKSS